VLSLARWFWENIAILAGGSEGVYLSDFSGLAYAVKIFSQSDDYSGSSLTNPTIPKKYKNEKISAVHLGRHVIIGANSVVLAGVNIAEGCSVGAMSLVTKSTEPWGIYFGSPARRIKNRSKEVIEMEERFTREREREGIKAFLFFICAPGLKMTVFIAINNTQILMLPISRGDMRHI